MSATDPIVSTRAGALRGARLSGVCVFKGIPYGAPTSGPGRFRPPRPPAPWSGARDARSFGNGCWQSFAPFPPGTLSHEIYASIFDEDDSWKLQGEDCLNLNVWTPEIDRGKRPVMVWFHGGSFTQGCASSRLYDGTRLALKGDVVIVTVNHRLNVFGYLHLADLDASFAQSANAGMLDLAAALAWVRDNIAAFGGDPGNVTIFGESGGGAKVCTLMAMPAAKGLFHRAIVQSGGALRANAREEGTTLARLLLAELGIPDGGIADLEAVAPQRLLEAATAAEGKFGRNMFDGSFGSWAPLVDGDSLPRHPFDPDAPSDGVPLMIGTTKNETTLALASLPIFATMDDAQAQAILTPVLGKKTAAAIELYARLYPAASPGQRLSQILTDKLAAAPAALIAERQSRRAPAYHYVMTWATPVAGGILGAVHALDIPLMFDNVAFARSLVGPGDGPERMAEIMSATWLAFARTGRPDNASIPSWQTYDAAARTTMIFDLAPHAVAHYDEEVRAFWQTPA